MNKMICALWICLAACVSAQTWVTATPPVVVTLNKLRADYIGLTISTNFESSGAMWVSRFADSNFVSRVCVPLPPGAVSNVLASCGVTLGQLGSLLLGSAGMANQGEFVARAEVRVDPGTDTSTVTIVTISGKRRVIPESVVNAAMTQAGGSVAVFQAAFLDYAKNHAN